ncbi:hypothetical protein JHJ32_07630 [Parapedobacter sp. ISTM3]|uniref:hypothetical protein n=1 Tax=Parapedobacter sp. ISTM3 TaxID=2800130 RepID=UPI001908CBF3|nr:hypothetical protein [Parapedobacter sp. ISTM3]MBK1439849.1 hypothetical protein [Parapedobacter sp. ISTM3]
MKLRINSLGNYLRIALLWVFLALSILSCKKEKPVETEDLEFIQETYYISEGDYVNVLIANGNKEYSLSGFDEELIVPMVSVTDFPAGAIYINALKKGTTDIMVKDDISGQAAKLTIHVVDPFLAMEVSDIVPIIKDEEYETGQAIRDKIRTEPQSFFDFETREVLVLQQNADNQFWLFKNEEDAVRGNIHKSGEFTIRFSYGGPNRLQLKYDGSEEAVEYDLYTPDQTAISTLLRWSQNSGAENNTEKAQSSALRLSLGSERAEVRQNTSPVDNNPQLFLIKDFTSFFKESYPTVERVDLFQSMRIYERSRYLKIADGILN